MKKIELSQGRCVLVDDVDYAWLSKYKWSFNGEYASRSHRLKNGKRKHLTMHEVLIYRLPGTEIDHKDQNKLNNQKDNLRLATLSTNRANRWKPRCNKSGYKGVSWRKQHSKWRAYISKDKKQMHIGFFDNKKDAALAYNAKAKEVFGEFACLNEC